MATCNVRTNTIKHMKTKGFLDENSIVRDPMFYSENARLSNLAREKYHVQNKKSLFFTHALENDNIKATPNEDMFRELQDRKDNPDDYRGSISTELTNEEMAQITKSTSNEDNIIYKITKLEDNVTGVYKQIFEDKPLEALHNIYEQAISSPEERKGAVSTVGEEMVQLAETYFANIEDHLKTEAKKPITVRTDPYTTEGQPVNHKIFRGKKEVGLVQTVKDGEYLTVNSAEISQPREGIGTEAYQRIGEEADKMGLTFRSDRLDRMNPASIGLWEKLVRMRKALKIGDHYYYGEVARADNLPPIMPKC